MSTVPPSFAPRNAQSGNSQYLSVTNDNNGLSLKNKDYFEKKKALASSCKGWELGNRDTNDPRQIPEKQGLSDNSDNTTTYFTTYSNYFEQILTLFDRLTPDEQAALLEALQGRIQSAAK